MRVILRLLVGPDFELSAEAEAVGLELIDKARIELGEIWEELDGRVTRDGIARAIYIEARKALARLAILRVAERELPEQLAAFTAALDTALADEELEDKLNEQLDFGELANLLEAAVSGSAEDPLRSVADALNLNLDEITSDSEEENNVADYIMDPRGLSQRLLADANGERKSYTDAVNNHVTSAIGGAAPKAVAVAATVGKLLRGGQTDEEAPSFPGFVKRTYYALAAEQRDRSGTMVTGIAVLEAIEKSLVDGQPISYQQLAFVYDEVSATLPVIGVADPSFSQRVHRAALDYAAAEVGYDNFEVPDIDASVDADLVPDNMISVAKMYAAFELERLKLFTVVDRIDHLFRNGLLAVGNDTGGRLLNDYYWERDERFPEGARALKFARLFGVKGPSVSKDVQPNVDFDKLMVRFLTNVAEYQRLREITSAAVAVGTGQASKMLIGETVRKTGRELAANLSLYGWGATHFDASRMAAHVKIALDIVGDAQVQKAFGANSQWQVIERVAQQELGVTPNVVKHATMAKSGKRVIEILASNPKALVTSEKNIEDAFGLQLFEELARHTQAWLSVNGVGGDEIMKLSAPVDAVASPSLPMQSGGGLGDGELSQLRQMVAGGQMPSMDQLQSLLRA